MSLSALGVAHRDNAVHDCIDLYLSNTKKQQIKEEKHQKVGIIVADLIEIKAHVWLSMGARFDAQYNLDDCFPRNPTGLRARGSRVSVIGRYLLGDAQAQAWRSSGFSSVFLGAGGEQWAVTRQ